MGSNAASGAALPFGAAPPDFSDTVVQPPPAACEPAADGAVQPHPEPPGRVGRYELRDLLGEGGIGSVHEAWDPMLSRTVAVKTLQWVASPADRVALDRLFLNEARAAAALSHPHIVTVFDAGLSAHGVYLAMERLRGRDLRHALADGWRPPVAQAVALVRRIADALAYAHARGVVHCDVKPANIFLTRSGKPKLLDFGIARIVRAAPPGAGVTGAVTGHGEPTRSPTLFDGVVAGSPHYVAPEQLRGEAVDGRTDVYGLGVVLYELLCGHKPFVGESLERIHDAVLHHTPLALEAIAPQVPPALAAVVARAMARDPAQRPTAAEFSLALRPFHRDGGPEAADAGDAGDAGAPRRAAVTWRRALAVGALAAAVVAAAWWLAPGADRAGQDTAAGAAALPTATGGGDAPVPITPATVPATPAATVDPSTATAAAATAPAAVATGLVRLDIRPGGSIEVDGNPAGQANPRASLALTEGPHLIIVRREGFPAFITEVEVRPGEPVDVSHRFRR